MQRISPPLRQRRLGQLLLALRNERGLTLAEAAARAGVSASKVSRIECAATLASPEDVDRLLNVYRPARATREACWQLVRQARLVPWWKPYQRVLGELPWWETEALIIHSWQPYLVPGLLQTPEYARAVFTSGLEEHEEMTRLRVEARMRRQQIIDHTHPAIVNAVVGEAALRRRIGGPQVMAEQLERLLTVAELPHVLVRVLPDSVSAHPGIDGAFVLLSLPGHDRQPMPVYMPGETVVYWEHPGQEVICGRQPVVEEYARRHARLARLALDPVRSRTLMMSICEEHRQACLAVRG